MLIGVKKRFVFVANSKAASTTIEKILTPHAEINRVGSPIRKHITWSEVLGEYAFLFSCAGFEAESFFKFGVIRNPVDWVRSWYNYRLGNKKIDAPLDKSVTFEAFWKSDDWVKKIRQKDCFCDRHGNFAFNFLIPQDELDEGLSRVLAYLDVSVPGIGKENKSPGDLAHNDIASDLVDEINVHYQQDLDLYHEWKDKIKTVSLDPAKRNLGGPQHDKQYSLQLHSSVVDEDWLLHVALDENTLKVGADGAFSCSGVAIMAEGAPANCDLELVTAVGSEPIEWGIESPWMAKKFAHGVNSTHARFRIQSSGCEIGSTLEVRYVCKGGEARSLLKFRILKGTRG